MFLQAYGAAALIILMALLLGRAICMAGGRSERWDAAPAVGLAALILLTDATIRLPGRAAPAVVITVLVLAGAVALVVRYPTKPRYGSIAVAALPVLGVSVQFVASGRVGIPGANVDNDMASHLLWAEGLRSSRMASLWPPSAGYPLGPHSLVATLGSGTGIPLDMGFTGLLLATIGITALVAGGVAIEGSLWRRIWIGLLSSLTYLVASYFAEGSFKEPLMAVLVLGFAVHLEQASRRWRDATALTRWGLVSPAVLLAAASVYIYSYLGIVWFAGTIVIWAVAWVVRRPRSIPAWLSVRRIRAESGWVLGGVGLGVIVLLPAVSSAAAFFKSYGVSPAAAGGLTTSNLGNLFNPLSPYEAFGVWTSTDYRLAPANSFHAGELAALALAIAVYGVWTAIRQRRFFLLAALAASWLIWWESDRSQSPYASAKALVILAPLLMAISLNGLLARRKGPVYVTALRLGLAVVLSGVALYSSYQDLRHQSVQAPEAARELAIYARTIGDSRVLFLGNDEYAPWQLRSAAVGGLFPAQASVPGAAIRPNKPFSVGQQLDFDSVAPGDLDHFRYVITGSGSYASQAPSNFQLLASAPLYDLWQRVGPTQPRQVIEPPGTPGAVLDCQSALGRRLSRERGVASTMPAPVVVPGPGGLAAGNALTFQIPLPAGAWELSIQDISDFNFELRADGRRWEMPAYLGRQGPFFDVGTVAGEGVHSPVRVSIVVQHPSILTGSGDDVFTYIPWVAATRVGNPHTLIPLSQACGKYVDWYRTTN